MEETGHKLTRVQAVTPFIIAGLFGLPAILILLARPNWGGWQDVAFGVCGAVLAFDVPVCVLILIGHPPVMTLAPLIPSAPQRAIRRNLRARPSLDDDSFYERFYAGAGIPKEIPIRVRTELEKAIGLDLGSVHPNDNVALADDELDFAEVLCRLNRTFKVKIPLDACWEEIDGTFDSLVRYVAKLNSE